MNRCDECSTAVATVCGTWCAGCYADLMADPAPAGDVLGPARPLVDDEGGPFRLEALAADRHGDRWGAGAR